MPSLRPPISTATTTTTSSLFSVPSHLHQEFQAALTARSNEVIDAAFDVQVFISERAQDLAPEQSRHLLGQLQRLQGAFHQASGQARARAETLSNQRAREEELQQKESAKVQEEEKEREIERQTARKIEVWMHADEFIDMNASLECVFHSPLCFAHERMSAFCFTIHNLLLVTVFII
jgi:hypothetical protein